MIFICLIAASPNRLAVFLCRAIIDTLLIRCKNNANTMFKLSVFHKRWRISENNRVVLSGIGNTEQALAIARAYGIVLSKIERQNYLKVA